MSTTVSDQARIKDPANHLLTRFPLRRLSAEEIRDSVLKVSGNFNPAMHGPSIFPVIEREVLAGQSRPGDGWRVSPPSERTRRSVYVHVKRSMLLPLLSSFDFADTDMTCPVRFQTTQPTQSLTLLTSAFISRQSRLFARDLVRRTPGDLGSQIEAALWRVTQRSPRPGEVGRGVRLVRTLQREEGLSREHALASFCRVALNLNEFLYVN